MALVAVLSICPYVRCMVLYTANTLPVLFQQRPRKDLKSRDDCSAPQCTAFTSVYM